MLDHLSQIVALLEKEASDSISRELPLEEPLPDHMGSTDTRVSCSSYHVFVLHKGDLLSVVNLLVVPLAEPCSFISQSDTS